MDIDYTVAALMFPAIPLMMTMYSTRFKQENKFIKICNGFALLTLC